MSEVSGELGTSRATLATSVIMVRRNVAGGRRRHPARDSHRQAAPRAQPGSRGQRTRRCH